MHRTDDKGETAELFKEIDTRYTYVKKERERLLREGLKKKKKVGNFP